MYHRALIIIALYVLTINLYASNDFKFPIIEGWDKSHLKTYDTETLWELINGAADYYLSYRFEELMLVEYQKTEDIYIKAEVYKHNNKLNAFGIYAYERNEDANFNSYGTEGYIIESTLVFYIDNYYIKVHSHNTDIETLNTIKDIAGKLASGINDTPSPPQELDLLPTEGRVQHSEKYYPANYMGYSFFKSVISAKYGLNESSYEVFCIPHSSTDDALDNLGKYFSFLKNTDELKSNQVYSVDDMLNDNILLIVKDSKLYGIWNMGNDIDKKGLEKKLQEM